MNAKEPISGAKAGADLLIKVHEGTVDAPAAINAQVDQPTSVTVTMKWGGDPVAGAQIRAVLITDPQNQTAGITELVKTTDAEGKVVFDVFPVLVGPTIYEFQGGGTTDRCTINVQAPPPPP